VETSGEKQKSAVDAALCLVEELAETSERGATGLFLRRRKSR
jgi:hypothetical protein